jgi:hypothetical protein
VNRPVLQPIDYLGAILAVPILVGGLVFGFFQCRARLEACEKARISFWLCMDDDVRFTVPMEDRP